NRAWAVRVSCFELRNNPGAQVSYYSVPLQKGESASLRPQVMALMLAVVFILLVACANLDGLTLVRMLRRPSDVATRMPLAASRLRIRTLDHLETLRPAFNPNGVMTAKVSLDDVRFHDPPAFKRLLAESTGAMRQVPGVQHAAVGLSLPYERAMVNGALVIS